MRHRRRHEGRFGWVIAKGIHRTVVGFLLVAVAVGAVAGAVGHAAMVSGAHSLLCLAIAATFVVFPLGWIATWRIAWPLRQLARVAAEIQGGRLESRSELPRAGGEVGEVTEAVRAIADRLAGQLRDQRALMAAVSHELRSPLGRARVLVEMAREGSAPPTLHDDLESEIAAMDGLVGDLLAAARIDFEAVSPRELAVDDVARRALQIAKMPADTLVSVGDPGVVHADATLLARALAGMLDNARRYGGRSVSLVVRDQGDRVAFAVEDDGPGFAPGDEERAFEPFWRGRPGASKGEGLGLALVRQIASAHGGTAGAANRIGGGARVWLEIPR